MRQAQRGGGLRQAQRGGGLRQAQEGRGAAGEAGPKEGGKNGWGGVLGGWG